MSRPHASRPRRRWLPPVLVLFALAAGSAAGVAIWEDNRDVMHRAAGLTGGDPHAGEQALLRYGCGGCHTIPGVHRARGLVGPPLTAYGKRIYLAGRVYNSPDNLVRWIMDPQAIDPGTAMPKIGVSEGDARDIAAYLYTLR